MVLGAWRQNELLQGSCFVLSVWMGVIVTISRYRISRSRHEKMLERLSNR